MANLTEKSIGGDVTIKPIELHQYRESIQKETESSKGEFPSDVSLKSINDLIQSIMSSIRREDPYYWLICEGSSEKMYFEALFDDEIKNKRLRVLPVGGAKAVLRILSTLSCQCRKIKNT